MNKHLEHLIQLSAIDKEIDAFEPQIEEAKHKLEAILATQSGISAQIEQLQNETRDEQIKKQKNELHLAELSQKLEENSRKSSEVRNEREMKSLQLEEEIAKEQVSFANEEIERLERVIANKKSKIDDLEAQRAKIDTNLASIRAEVDEKLSKIEAERQVVFGKKEQLVSQMNQKGLAFYQKIRRWAKNSTAVPVRRQACMGCYMAINDKTYAEVIKGEEITTCPHCGRLLYLEESGEASA